MEQVSEIWVRIDAAFVANEFNTGCHNKIAFASRREWWGCRGVSEIL
jgi:hypothetical protein